MKFEVRFSQNKKWYWNLIAKNGKVVATSEMYDSKQAAKKGITAVKRIAFFAPIVDLTTD
jgi:uncharacterized protein YegP (UPF0339 family)